MLHLEGLVLVFPGPEGSLRNKLVCLTHYSDSSEETDTGTLQHHRSDTVGLAARGGALRVPGHR